MNEIKLVFNESLSKAEYTAIDKAILGLESAGLSVYTEDLEGKSILPKPRRPTVAEEEL